MPDATPARPPDATPDDPDVDPFDAFAAFAALTVEEAADRLGIDVEHIRRMVVDGTLPTVPRIADLLRIPAEAVDAYDAPRPVTTVPTRLLVNACADVVEQVGDLVDRVGDLLGLFGWDDDPETADPGATLHAALRTGCRIFGPVLRDQAREVRDKVAREQVNERDRTKASAEYDAAIEQLRAAGVPFEQIDALDEAVGARLSAERLAARQEVNRHG